MNAKHEQQNRRYVYRFEEAPEHPLRNDGDEPQAVHLWVFLGIEGALSMKIAGVPTWSLPPVHAFRTLSPYSWPSCSPAELGCASDDA